MLAEHIAGVCAAEGRLRAGADGSLGQRMDGIGGVGDDLSRGNGRQRAAKLTFLVGKLTHIKLARRHVRIGKARALALDAYTGKKVVLPLGQGGLIRHGTGGDDARDFALDQPLGQGGILHLLADGHTIAFFDQAGDIGIHRVIGHAAHGRALRQAAVAPRKGQLQLAAGGQRVVKEHFIKIAQAVEKQLVGVLLLNGQVLLHHGRNAANRRPCHA